VEGGVEVEEEHLTAGEALLEGGFVVPVQSRKLGISWVSGSRMMLVEVPVTKGNLNADRQ
jgi:hypothetical protein